MIKKYLLLTLAVFLLTACGGSSKDKPLFGENGGVTDGQDNGTTEESPPDSDVSTSTEIKNPRLGTGTEATFELGKLELSLAALSAGGTTKISANIVDKDNGNKKIVSQNYKVVFTSTCSETQPAKAEFNNPEINTASGSVSVIYTAKGCSGEDTISANLFADAELKHTAIGKVNVELAELGSISFVEAASPALSISTIANMVLPQATTVTFKVVDKSNYPISDKEVTFSLSKNTGGVELAKTSGLTNNEGLVSAIVQSGDTHLITGVIATTLANNGVTKLRTSSQPISITTGLPRQDGFSISLSTFNPGAFNMDGVQVDVTATASDAFRNFIPDGTVINFMAESGTMQSYCITEAGQCTAVWKSGGARPGQYNTSLNLVNEQIGVTTILAYTMGEAGFTDSNGNNRFDDGEPFLSFAEPFRDDNWNANLDTSSGRNVEDFVDTNNDGLHTAAESTRYQGALCSVEAQGAGHCESLMHVRDQARLVQSLANSIKMTLYENCNADLTGCTEFSSPSLTPTGGVFWVVLQDANGNIPASKSTLAVTGNGYKIFGSSGEVENNIGELAIKIAGITALPDYGQIFVVSYVPEDLPKDIILKAESGGAKLSLLLK